MFGGIMGTPEAQIDGTTESGIPTTEKHWSVGPTCGSGQSTTGYEC
jgi:hypothetical protein